MSLTNISTLLLSPYLESSRIVSKSLIPVNRFASPSRVPPPIIVPETLSNELKLFTLIIDTPEPIDMRSFGN